MTDLQDSKDIRAYLQLLHSAVHPASATNELRKPDFADIANARIQNWHSTAAWVLDVGVSHAQAMPVEVYTDKYADTVKQCYRNSLLLAAARPELTYTEGYAFSGTVPICVTHAWCTDPDGVVVDPTWSKRNGLAVDFSKASYYGVPMQKSFVEMVVADTGLYGVLDSIWMSRVARETPMDCVLPASFLEKLQNTNTVDAANK